MKTNITDAQITALMHDAIEHGDDSQVRICIVALHDALGTDDAAERATVELARATCLQVLCDNARRSSEEE